MKESIKNFKVGIRIRKYKNTDNQHEFREVASHTSFLQIKFLFNYDFHIKKINQYQFPF